MRQGLVTLATIAALSTLAALAARADDPGKPPPPQKKPAVPEVTGIRWEADLEAGLHRAAREGRPVLLAVNALEGEGANEMLRREAYPSQLWGRASRPFVCFVGNNETHEETQGPDGRSICPRFGAIPCRAHKDAIGFIVRRFGSLISPQHAILEPDGGVAYHKDYYTGEESPPFLDAWAARLSPRLVTRHVWTAREQRMKALTDAPPADLEATAKEWLATGDASYATAGVVAMLDQEGNAAKRAALFAALTGAPPEAASLLFDPVDAVTSAPDANPEDAVRWVDVALAVAPDLGDWGAARVTARAKDRAHFRAALSRWSRTANAKPPAETPRRPLPEGLKDPSRDTRRAALTRATAEDVRGAKDAVRAALLDPVEEVRVAAAVALRRAGDTSGADLLLGMLLDPVEGPEVRHALIAWHGEDLGDDSSAWEPVLRAEGGGR